MKKKIMIPQSSVELKNKVKDSIFWGNIKYVKTIEEAERFKKFIKEKYHDATHNVSAYFLNNKIKKNLEYYDDDGEPAKSAGPPILESIKGMGLVNTIIVVTRYFGGTQLGIGGLIRAYGGTARMTINKAGIKELKLYFYVKTSGNYNNIGTILGQIESFSGEIKKTTYRDEGVDVFYYIKPEVHNLLKGKLIEKTGNKVSVSTLKKIYL